MVGTRPLKTRCDTTVGSILVAARRRHGLTLHDVSLALKIPVKHLQGLEEGDLSSFSAEVYARGAFMQYAAYLGVQADQTQQAFLRVLSGAREYVPLRVHTPKPWLQRIMTPTLILALGGTGLALVVGAYIVLQVESFLHLPALAIKDPSDSIVQGSTVTIRGTTESDVQIAVNGEPALLDQQAGFSKTLVLHPGINVLQVEATNAAGRKRVITRDLLMPRFTLPQS